MFLEIIRPSNTSFNWCSNLGLSSFFFRYLILELGEAKDNMTPGTTTHDSKGESGKLFSKILFVVIDIWHFSAHLFSWWALFDRNTSSFGSESNRQGHWLTRKAWPFGNCFYPSPFWNGIAQSGQSETQRPNGRIDHSGKNGFHQRRQNWSDCEKPIFERPHQANEW